ncbi:hypothetical protein GLOTRDRAFT_95158 [Gloeophyllum trabeum ATCC 11539]|uniref:Uncharacterized protein n=1 Tax=Gloeophyllum trabeum (strain ATCC 11539 / FP-39264 / Madison 617) TaxID=670483 RepID=S7PZP1_GLOTA|nr:uncharacterized protein GLOTRDRAFT_95158 [Gloeophyllum trabeum ATCC 11539]EPQ53136.1 hypothetical protein GLOTRDRAFT_95158 [Gloeophyllum trabeum ATCC 11539]
MPSLSHNQWTILQAVVPLLLFIHSEPAALAIHFALRELNSILTGVYSVIFLGCLYIFFSQYNEAQHKRLVLINIVLFLLCTAQWASFFLLALLTTDPVSDYTAAVKQAYVKDILVDLNSLANTAAVCTADGLLIWRCRKIWGGRLSVVVLPILVLIVGAGCGIVNFVTITIQIAMQHANALADPSPPPLWFTLANISADVEIALAAASFLVNMLMTVLIGARIWWNTRGLNEMFGRNQRKEYIRVILVVLESGAVYSLLLLLSMIFTALAGDSANKYNDYLPSCRYISYRHPPPGTAGIHVRKRDEFCGDRSDLI